MMIGQLKPRYLYNLSMYNKTLEQRNSFLKNKIDNFINFLETKLNFEKKEV